MVFNINTFSSHISKKGIVKTSNFDIQISRDFSPDINAERDISMRCIATDLPGVTITTIEHSYVGPTHKFATGSSYLDQNLQILLSKDLAEKKYFEAWRRAIVGNYSSGETGPNMYRLSYYKDYIGSVIINTYDENGRKNYSVKLHEAFPIMINSIALSWASGAELATLPVTLAYKYYTEETV